MKLRIKGNSVRFRLSQAEVGRLANDGAVWETTGFGPTTLRYGVEADPGSKSMDAVCREGQVHLTVPRAMIADWAGTEQVSLQAEKPIADGVLKILLEKDFQCLVPREDEDESDLFPHPEAAGQ